MTSPSQRVPYLRTQRKFPDTAQELSVELSRSYVDIAQTVNARTIGIFALGNQVATGESWYLAGSSQRQQSLRQFYTFTSAGSIPHGLNLTNIFAFVRIFGAFTDGTSWYPLPYVNATAANNQVQVVVTATNIVITSGGGAPPAIVSGIVVLEWLSQV